MQPLIKTFRLIRLSVLCGIFFFSIAIPLTNCRTKKNLTTPMGWLSHKKLQKHEVKRTRKTKKKSDVNRQPVQQWYRDWVKEKEKEKERKKK
ncbi:MAG: hypothetical protein ABII90_11720 [Bacteroidota bacterium]